MRYGKLAGLGVVGSLVLLVPAVQATDQDAINQAIDHGVAYLKRLQQGNGTWPRQEIGATALAALALLECDVPENDPTIQKAADAVRQEASSLTYTYSLALSIMFLDRLGDPADIPLIESFAVRLIAGQGDDGGWTYDCPSLSDQEMRRLTALTKPKNQLITKADPARGTPLGKRTAKSLPKEIQAQINLIYSQPPRRGLSDNSNTQFALLALWIARRQGIPVQIALGRLEMRFRNTQNGDGGWGYFAGAHGSMSGSSASMTCAGLLGMAVAHGLNAELRTGPAAPPNKTRRDPARDPSVRAGLLALGTAVGQPVGDGGRKESIPVITSGSQAYYFLWSLERVGVIYGLKTIGKKDWYAWGSEIVVASQGADGSWQGQYFGGGVDTCFALLFLKKANLAPDLTATLKGQVRDPGEVNLKGGGVGGDFLITKALAPGIASDAKPDSGSGQSPPVISKGNGATTELDNQATRLKTELLQADPSHQGELIEKYKDSKGPEFTQALADSIHELDGTAKAKARDALAERLSRMTADTLRARLQDADLEIRSAAALACGMRDDKTSVPYLIPLLKDSEARVEKAAHLALKSLTGADFGPGPSATSAERTAAITAWKAWWDRQNH